jgi:peptidoglycan/LPS O-acetylase OafA/YrhL
MKGAFRTDINGLRALAVGLVVLYHFGLLGASGGFIGVDVFFVISGYLMTQIIATDLGHNRFSLLKFYAARAKRIIPALAVLVAFLLGLGWFIMPPSDYKSFGWQALSAATFVSNIVLSHGGDYFDTSAREKWLLHTWSLSVEWQFYMLYPLLLMFLRKWRMGWYFNEGVMAAFLFSLAVSLCVTPWQPTAAFYLLVTRAWELLAGALVFLSKDRPPRIPYAAELGLLAILASGFLFSAGLDFPGGWAALPVLGAALVIAARERNRVLDNAVAQFFGTISYSLYLWHWPVMVAARIFDVSHTLAHELQLVAIAIFLATLSYMFVESPFRKLKKTEPLPFLGASIALSLLIALLSFGVYKSAGVPSRVSPDVLAAVPEAVTPPLHGDCAFDYKARRSEEPRLAALPNCILGANVPPTAALWGDSHVNPIAVPLGQALIAAQRSAALYSYAGCPPVLDAIFASKWKKSTCRNINRKTFDSIMNDKRIRDVFLVARWPLYTQGYNEKGAPHPYVVFDKHTPATAANLDARSRAYADKMAETICKLTAAGKKAHVMAAVAEMPRNVPDALARSRMLTGHDIDISVSMDEYEARNADVLQAIARSVHSCHADALDPWPYLCNARACPGISKGKPLYSDSNHLSAYGARLLKPLFVKALQ